METPPAGKRASKAVVVGFLVVAAPFCVPVVADVWPDLVFVFLTDFAVVEGPEPPVSDGEVESSVFEGSWVFCAAAAKGVQYYEMYRYIEHAHKLLCL